MAVVEPKGRLELWTYIEEAGSLWGLLYGHPDFPEGAFVHTSKVVKIEDDLAYTANSVYRLGKPSSRIIH